MTHGDFAYLCPDCGNPHTHPNMFYLNSNPRTDPVTCANVCHDEVFSLLQTAAEYPRR